MKTKAILVGIIMLVVMLVVAFTGCIEMEKTTKIGDILDNPQRYSNKSVVIEGYTLEGYPLPFYQQVYATAIIDETGKIPIKFRGNDLPKPNEIIRVHAKVYYEERQSGGGGTWSALTLVAERWKYIEGKEGYIEQY
ncbi:hypothetical protein CW713_12060 [Methanophagales archaeon]|nr:MAG: hypothetical protein CW714_10230 [Methanophagales archaeon]RJS75526.1 MAG: hypothetical protein CW713_12060 [Methanophagales archaeon]